jgi:hypothetical protein
MRGGCVSKSSLLHVTNLFCSAGHESMMLKENMNMVERSGKVKVCECVPSQVVRCVSELIKYADDPDPLKTKEVIATLGQILEGEAHTYTHTCAQRHHNHDPSDNVYNDSRSCEQ